LVLLVQYTPNYPDEVPDIALEDCEGLSDDEIEEANAALQAQVCDF
jgi:hypothetical protein